MITITCRQDDLPRRLLKEGVRLIVRGTKYRVRIEIEDKNKNQKA